MDFPYFKAFLNFLQLFFRTKVSTQASLKFFLWLQKQCSKHLGASTAQGLYNAHRMKVIGCLEKKWTQRKLWCTQISLPVEDRSGFDRNISNLENATSQLSLQKNWCHIFFRSDFSAISLFILSMGDILCMIKSYLFSGLQPFQPSRPPYSSLIKKGSTRGLDAANGRSLYS